MISVIIRTKNEEEWIEKCLTAIENQDYSNVETIIVDNESTDKTLDIAETFDCKITNISDEEFTYGRALNMGMKISKGEYLACISAHCIPLNNRWLDAYLNNFTDNDIAASYGRQEPLPDSSDFDKRDLWTTFGQEKKVQKKDYFFHNANSMIRRDVWEKIPFDEDLSGVEDRAWAKKVIEEGYKIIYEPKASVYHKHGIHQGRDEKRAKRVVKVIELIQEGKT